MKTLLRYQVTEYDCGPTTMTNAIMYLFERVEEFAGNEYENFILVDFYTASPETKALFDSLSDLNYIILQLSGRIAET